MLKNDLQTLKLFSTIPTFKNIIKSYHPNGSVTLIPRYKEANQVTVERAYDFWCRAFIQLVNKKEVETDIPVQVVNGVEMAYDSNFITQEQREIIYENIKIIWDLRRRYFQGENVNEEKLLMGCLVLANCEEIFKNRGKSNVEKGILAIKKDDLIDLKNIVTENKKFPRLFQSGKGIKINPTFGEYSKLVGGADADYILGNMLVDIKTAEYSTMRKEHIHQLIGYYLLSTYNQDSSVDIKQLGILFPRHNTLKYIDINNIEKKINLSKFSYYFKNIIDNQDIQINEMSFQKLKSEIVI